MNTEPPKIAIWFLSLLVRSGNRQALIGDLQEEYRYICTENGRLSGIVWIISQIFVSLVNLIRGQLFWSIVMIKSYIKVALRNIQRYKAFSLINIFGLALGMVCCILMLLWVQDELSWDKFHKNGNEIYRVIAEQQSKDQIIYNARTPNPLLPVLLKDYPEIVKGIRFQGFSGWNVKYGDKVFSNDDLGTADPSFFEMFSFPFIKGDPKTALKKRYSIVITEDMAKKYFGDDDPMGKQIEIGINYTVTGVIKNLPHNSHLHFDCIFPIINMERAWDENFEDWNRIVFYTYIQLQENSSVKEVGNKIAEVIKKHNPQSNINKIFFQSLNDVHLYSNFQWDLDNYDQGNISYVYIFALSALCILLVACINFMNLYTARSSNRAKEVGMRKVVGAFRSDILKQFFGESLLISFISSALAIFLTFLFLPVFNDLSGKDLILDIKTNFPLGMALIVITLLMGIVSGSYPALFLSSFKPVKVLKGSITGTKTSSILRKTLITIQFAFTVILIIGSIVIYNQLDYMRNTDLGFDKDYLIYFPSRHLEEEFEAARSELMQNPDILNLSLSVPPNGKPWAGSNFEWEGKDPDQKVVMYPFNVDYNYLNTFNMEITDGRFFLQEFSTDTSNYVINEAAVKAMGMVSPVGKRFSHEGRVGKIIGIIKDFHQSSLHTDIEPLVLGLGGETHYVSIRLSAHNIPQTIMFIEDFWKSIAAEQPFSYEFLDVAIDNFYKTERNIYLVIQYFTLLILLISCLGLVGLASFINEQRFKEIGIRKVLGATVSGIVLSLSKDFTKWIVLANIIAWPIAWFAMNNWLHNFAYRINLGIGIFLLSGMLALTIALLTTSYQSIKVALTNPVNALRNE